MKLANIYAADTAGTLHGQAAAGTSDGSALNVRVCDAGGVMHDIRRIIVTDRAGAAAALSSRLLAAEQEDYRYVRGPLSCPAGNCFNNYSESDAVEWRVSLECMIETAAQTLLASSRPGSGYGWDVTADAKGRVVLKSSYNSKTTVTTWETALTPGVWHTVALYGFINKASDVWLSVDGGAAVKKAAGYKSYTGTARALIIGDSHLLLRGSVIVKGINWSSLTAQRTLSVNIESVPAGQALSLSGGGYTLTGGTVEQHRRTVYSWEPTGPVS